MLERGHESRGNEQKRAMRMIYFVEPLSQRRDYFLPKVFVPTPSALILQQEMVDAIDAALHPKRLVCHA